MLNLAPEYTAFGDQKFDPTTITNVPTDIPTDEPTDEPTDAPVFKADNLIPCTLDVQSDNICLLTQVFRFLGPILVGMPFFGVLFYVANWAFIGVFIVATLYSLICFHPKYDSYSELDDDDPERLEPEFM